MFNYLQLDHLPQELVDLVLPVAEVSTLDKVVGLLSPSPSWVVQLEGPQEVRGVLEVGSNREDLRGTMSEQMILIPSSVALQNNVVRKD